MLLKSGKRWTWNAFLPALIATLVRFTVAKEAILLDTRTALSDLGWTMSPGSEWQEMTSPDAQGNERRMNMVCQITKPNQDNWIRTDYIAAEGAQRLHVEMKFTIRSCEDVENVATCKETFNFYYYETDRDEATSTFPPWREGAYTKVDTIAADQRFSPGSDDTNFETRDIGPITKNGLYLAFQDTGACVALMYIRVYYKYCAETISNLAVFRRTTAGSEMTSLVDTTGTCVQHAVATNGLQPTLYCNAEGDWMVPSGSCTCEAGYQANAEMTKCTACSPGYFKSTVSNDHCQRCPAFSSSRSRAATSCRCTYGYFRSPNDDLDQPCTMPASRPRNLYSVVNKTSVRLYWERPQNDGGRDDLWYSVQCFRCQQRFVSCSPCSNHIDYDHASDHITSTEIAISSLSSYAFYKFQVISINAVTNIAASSGHRISNYAEVTVQTNQAAPSAVLDVRVLDINTDSFLVVWNPPATTNGQILDYEVMVAPLESSSARDRYANRTTSLRLKVEQLKASTRYVVKVRARTQEGFGPYSSQVTEKTSDRPTAPTKDELDASGSGIDISLLAIAVAGAIILILVVLAAIFVWRRRTKARKSRKADKEKQPIFNGNSVSFNGSFPSQHKTYIDPTTYEDPNRAVREFTKEIDATCVKIEEVIGGGEFGEVCRGRLQPNSKTERDVAIKTLKSGYSTQQKLDFLGEASIMGQFDHPNVIRLEGVVTKSRPLMIITEFMENGSLDVFLRNHDNHFTVIQLVGMLRNIAAGMKYLSDMGYVHRDLAARNILVNAQLICKVSDFGMSRVLEEDSEAAYTARGGKIPIRWTAPEAFTFRKFTSASDVWSYGIVMWEVMSYGERPYWGMSNRDVMNAVETGYRLPAPMDCPQVQHRLMLDCWKKDRNQRPKFAQIVASLDKMLRDPAQLKIKASHERPRNGRLANGQCRPSSALGQAAAPASTMVPVTRTASSPPHSSSNGDSGYSNEETDEEVPLVATGNEPAINVSSLGAWLDSIDLSHCKESFTRNGCTSLEQVLQLTHDDLERMGIDNADDQDHLIEMIRKISSQQEGADADDHGMPSSVLPSYNESQRLTGISV